MKNTVKINSVELVNADSLHYVATLPDNSIDLIVTDPPYFKVKPNGWDNQWKGDEDYLRWLDSCLAEYARVLKPAGSIYLFCGHRLASDIEIMTPLIDYFRNARESLGVSSKEIAEATGKKNMASHWFGASQWQLPNEVDYRKLQELFTRIAIDKHIQQKLEHPHHQLVATYQSLNRKYSELLEEYKTLRRCFSVSALVPYTDVWTHKPVQFYPGKHPCEKPADMLKQIISASSRPGDIVADFFMGSGSTVKAAIELGRRAIGVELEADRFIQTTEEVEKLSKT
ncbi:site-specific DNA-methyltransferase [Escherichia coli]|uniref:DNA-methyltransferase n=1 Tax=Escherichia coli TaxID=562 RepID=UPI000F9C78FD|nr:site-specific DNA-methyltransferase [Escherichia coli]EFC9681662.1 site-specific DNA-methyltransferase [Escherichia coli]EFH5385174.1 site-specific DNA-methyltransferase [Escherichia coli]EIU0565014.1 site-specific DNA-methyltransferase [Escherichia coli]EKE7649302.1 site-specific DNA-methyltransferase [Escherichia coli]EKG4411464.1 site-specific DNA-methyltransferase [Escherichia coli]